MKQLLGHCSRRLPGAAARLPDECLGVHRHGPSRACTAASTWAAFQARRWSTAKPVIIVRQPVAVRAEPVYLYVPPGHQKNWAKHCGSYGACARPVYFVQESWVRERYDEQQRGHDGKQGKKHGKQNKHQG